jgi:hypothetical protein
MELHCQTLTKELLNSLSILTVVSILALGFASFQSDLTVFLSHTDST